MNCNGGRIRPSPLFFNVFTTELSLSSKDIHTSNRFKNALKSVFGMASHLEFWWGAFFM